LNREFYGIYAEILNEISINPPNLGNFIDWSYMKIKKSIIEGKDYIFISQSAWYKPL